MLMVAALWACGERPATAGAAAQRGADRIFVNGHVLTMNDAQPEAQAVAVKDGRILLVGTTAEIEEFRDPTTTVTDLGGKTLLPGFIDGRGHLVDYATRWTMPHLSPPPVGRVRSIADIQATLTKYLADARATPERLVIAIGDADSLLKEKRHPTRAELDVVSAEIPIIILHASGRLLVANSAALAKVGHATATATDPPVPLLPRLSRDEQLRALDAAQRWYASYGVTTTADRMSESAHVALLRDAADQQRLILDIVPGAAADASAEPPDMLRLAWLAVTRSSSGVAGPDVSSRMALEQLTIEAARRNAEGPSKGSLEPGKRADLVVLSDDPLTARPAAIGDITVLETLKDGKTIFTAAEGKPAGPGAP